MSKRIIATVDNEYRLLCGDVRERLRTLPEQSVNCCVTSSPYYGLRDYGVAGQIGLEKSPEEFIATLVDVFREVKRVLRKDATLWLNLGDSYSNAGKSGGHSGNKNEHSNNGAMPPAPRLSNLGPKQLMCMPWRTAIALQTDGWVLRQAFPWIKRSAMPESCFDRPSSALEYMFLLTKEPNYFYDAEAVRQPLSEAAVARQQYGYKNMWGSRIEANAHTDSRDAKDAKSYTAEDLPTGRNWRNSDLWLQSLTAPHGLVGIGDQLVGLDVTNAGTKEAHFATYPKKLVEPCLRASTSAKGCCPYCYAPWRRLVESERVPTRPGTATKLDTMTEEDDETLVAGNRDPQRHVTRTNTVGWEPTCACPNPEQRTIPCTVLDPFLGSGTTLLVAHELGLNGIGTELNPDYFDLAYRRLETAIQPAGLFGRSDRD